MVTILSFEARLIPTDLQKCIFKLLFDWEKSGRVAIMDFITRHRAIISPAVLIFKLVINLVSSMSSVFGSAIRVAPNYPLHWSQSQSDYEGWIGATWHHSTIGSNPYDLFTT